MNKIRVAVLGATGYSGAESVRLLLRHPRVEIAAVTAEQHAGQRLAAVHPSLRQCGLELEPLEPQRLAGRVDVVFCALPENAAAECIPTLVGAGVRVVDISAAFRIRDDELHRKWYPDPAPDLRRHSVYGLVELYRNEVRTASLVANPGCYPTGILLGLAPLLRGGVVAGPVYADAKSGVTGARRKAAIEQLFAEVNENVRAYAIGNHRHVPELEQAVEAILGHRHPVLFAPHLVPMSRGILTTMYVPLAGGVAPEDLTALYEKAYRNEPFVPLAPGRWPELREVRGTNDCAIGWSVDAGTRTAVVVTALDNLGKGAAGQALQNLNVMFDLPETEGLAGLAWVP